MSSKSSRGGRRGADSGLTEVVEVAHEPQIIVRRRGGRALAFVVGAGVGAAIMYALDPQEGNRRRALVRDQVAHYQRMLRVTQERASGTVQDIRRRANGMLARLRAQFALGTPTDEVLVARIRARLGHVVSHPSAIEVTAHEGHVLLRGPILLNEVDRTLMAVRLIPGVVSLDNQLETYATPEVMPGLRRVTP